MLASWISYPVPVDMRPLDTPNATDSYRGRYAVVVEPRGHVYHVDQSGRVLGAP